MLFGDPSATNPLTLLDGLLYLEPNEASLTEDMIPFIENTRLNTVLVDYRYAKESSNINKEYTVVVDEADVVLNPSVLNEYQHMVVRPISKEDEEFRFVEDVCYSYLGEAAEDEPLNPNYKYKIVTMFNNHYRKLHPTGPGTQNMTTVNQVVKVLNSLFPNLNPNFLDKRKIKKLLKKHHHFANFTDQTIVDLVGLGIPKLGLRPKVDAPTNPALGLRPKADAPPKTTSGGGGNTGSTGGGNVPPPKTTSGGGGNTGSTGGGNVPPPKTPTLQRYLIKAKDTLWDNKGKISAGLVAAAGAAVLYKHIIHKLESKPKSALGKRIAALRHIYTSWMERARRANQPGIAVKLRKAAATILHVIDMLLAKLQNSAERSYRMGGNAGNGFQSRFNTNKRYSLTS